MSDPQAGCPPALRTRVYAILIFVGAGAVLGRILAVDSVTDRAKEEYIVRKAIDAKRSQLARQGLQGERLDAALAEAEAAIRQSNQLRRPMLSANDRSRWCTIRALVEPEMRVEGHPYAIDKVIAQRGWDTIDMVKPPGGHLYSSKPPLLPTLMAGVYWVIYHTTGWTLGQQPFEVVRLMLIIINLLPLVLYFFIVARLAERFCTTDWSRMFVVATAVFGTFLTTFAVVINNHVPAAVCTAIALYGFVRIWFDDERRLRWFVLAGFFAALAAADELPALSLLALLSAALLWKAPRATLLAFVPSALVVIAAFFVTNWIAVGGLKPAYAHRSPGDNWYDYTYVRNGREVESYWHNPKGLDAGEKSRETYALHMLVGHHGVFSLSPVWLLSVLGTSLWLARRGDRRLRQLAAIVGLLTVVCLAFYLARPLSDRNYGGMSSGPRWMFWFAPLWLVVMAPAADLMAGRRWTRAVALVLLALSVVAVAYPTWNPWTYPYLYDFWYYMDWL